MKCSFLIVDDEKLSRDYLCDLVTEFHPEGVIHQAASAKTALPILENIRPDILFLDIKMPGMDGFTMLDLVSHRDFELVFVTAYSDYAIQAIKENVSDYLLKPVKKSDFRDTLTKVINKRSAELALREFTSRKKIHSYLGNKLSIHHNTGIKTLTLGDVVYIKADNTYTTLYLEDGEKIVTSKPIHHFEKLLSQDWFFRIHKSHIINWHHFKEYSSRDKKLAVMSNGDKLLISRYRLTDFLKKMKTLTEQKG